MTAFQLVQVIECGLWWTIGATTFAIAERRGMPRPRVRLTVITLFLFGCSDLVEATTGAWYKPWWLFTWKAACVAIFLYILIASRQNSSRR